MKGFSRKNRILALILVPCILVSGLAAAWLALRASQKPDPSPQVTLGDPVSDLTQQERAEKFDESKRITQVAYKTVVGLRMADGPGRPASMGAGRPGAALRSDPGPRLAASVASPFSAPSSGLRPLTDFHETIVLRTPSGGDVLQPGSKLLLEFELTNPSAFKFDFYLSTDGGKTYAALALAVLLDTGTAARSYEVVVPSKPSTDCQIRIETYFDDARKNPYAAGVSPRFAIAAAATPSPSPTPTPSPTPAPTPTPEPAEYVQAVIPFIDRNQDATRWIALDLDTDRASKIVWQVSRTPFVGFATKDSLAPPGLLAYGEVEPTMTEFPIDFGALVGHAEIPLDPDADPPENRGTPFQQVVERGIVYQSQYDFYLRAVAVDATGTVIGDPGTGMEFQFGMPRTVWDEAIDQATSSIVIQVWVAEDGKKIGAVGGNPVLHVPSAGILAHPSDAEWNFEVRSAPKDTYTCEFQVSTGPFEKGVFDDPKGLVWRLPWAEGHFVAGQSVSFSLPLHAFVPPAAEVGSKIVKYYSRMVFRTRNAADPSASIPIASETQVIYYTGSTLERNPALIGNSDLLPTEIVRVKSHVPLTRFISYEPMQWESPDWKQWFEVTRRIQAEEMTFTIHNNNVGKSLYPYSRYHFDQPTAIRQLIFNDPDPSMTREQYQAMLDAWLPVGANFPLSVEDASSLWGDMWSLASSIYTSVANAYNGAKQKVISTVVDVLPDGDLKEAVRTAVTILADTGLAMIGLPPTLPDFTALASEGLDYALEIAINEACQTVGIPPNEITDELRAQMRDGLMSEIEARAASTYANPLGVDYLKPYSKKIYRPGYVVFLVNNTGDEYSIPGTATLGYSTVSGGSVSIYDGQSIPIPPLAPGQFLYIRVYLKEFPDTTVEWEQFRNLFFGYTGTDCRFTLHVKYQLADLMASVEAQGLKDRPDDNPLLKDEYVFDHPSTYSYSYVGMPCDPVAEGDPNVDAEQWEKDEG